MIRILEYVEDRYDCCLWNLYKTHEYQVSEEDAFNGMYNLQRGSRYDNRRHYIFSCGCPITFGRYIDVRRSEDESLRAKYNDWYKTYNTIEHFYGGFVYD